MYEKVLNSFNELSGPIFRDVWLPRIYDMAWQKDRSKFAAAIPRNSDGVRGTRVKIPSVTRWPWAWRALDPVAGVFPTGGTFDVATQTAQLSCHASSVITSLDEIVNSSTDANAWLDIINARMESMAKTFPFYMDAVLFSSNAGMKAIGKAASISGTTVTLDNAGLWHTVTADRAKLFIAGMVVQWYRSSTVKVGSPVIVQAVDYVEGKVTLDEDPGIADNDFAVPSDLGGQQLPYTTLFPGILDAMDDANTFQGIDRSLPANIAFRSRVESASGKTLNYRLLADFFARIRSPKEAYTNPELVRAYWDSEIAANVRYTPTATFEDGFQYVVIDGTRLIGDDSCDRDKVLCPRLGEDGKMRIADLGGLKDPFGKGWQQAARRTVIEHDMVYWGLLLAEDLSNTGYLKDITLPTAE